MRQKKRERTAHFLSLLDKRDRHYESVGRLKQSYYGENMYWVDSKGNIHEFSEGQLKIINTPFECNFPFEEVSTEELRRMFPSPRIMSTGDEPSSGTSPSTEPC